MGSSVPVNRNRRGVQFKVHATEILSKSADKNILLHSKATELPQLGRICAPELPVSKSVGPVYRSSDVALAQ